MSLLATVVSDGSPGSSLLIADGSSVAAPLAGVWSVVVELLRARLDGGTAAADVTFPAGFLGWGLVGPVDSSPSSPEASREDGWRRSAATGLGASAVMCWDALRLRLWAVDGEDMMRTEERSSLSVQGIRMK